MTPRVAPSVATLCLLASAAAHAATFNLYGTVSQVYDPTFTHTLPFSLYSSGPSTFARCYSTAPVVFQVDMYFTISNLQPGESGFGIAAFDINTTGLTDVGGWNPDQSSFTYKTGAITHTQLIWGGNNDIGTSTTDLKSIVAFLNNPPYTLQPTTGGPDPRATLGQYAPQYLGSLYFQCIPTNINDYFGPGTTKMALGNVQYATYDTNAVGGQFSFGKSVTDSNILYFITPEPTSLTLLSAGALSFLHPRRRR